MGDEDSLLPNDLDIEEGSPYLRRQKKLEVRRRRFPRRMRWILLGVPALLSVSTASYYLVSFALLSPRFTLSSSDDVLVDGNQYVSRDEVLSVLGLPTTGLNGATMTMFRLPLAERTRQVESIPWVRSATLARAYPHRLAVHVVERVPVAFVSVGGRLKLVDSEGVFLERPERAVFDFPVLTGLETTVGPPERKSRIALYQDFEAKVGQEAAPSGWLISEVNLADADDLKALMVQGSETIRVHFGDRNFLERFHSFLELLPELRKANTNIDSVDLRYQGQIVVNPRLVTSREQELTKKGTGR